MGILLVLYMYCKKKWHRAGIENLEQSHYDISQEESCLTHPSPRHHQQDMCVIEENVKEDIKVGTSKLKNTLCIMHL